MTEILANLNWTTIFATALSSGFVAIIIGIFQLITTRYVTRALDHFEKVIKVNKKGES